ncbi:hypothetical protein PIIN_03441 [Serendipita indica DSM 11827]|uniref:RAM signaling network component n=1 Tax=Serendipita indica (strain DSM 11827) TaxID=1109443 RepID=G4U2I9_SERID|nr:hypothetical protein PIIN_03441 [Serendipita indica DSM 11827]
MHHNDSLPASPSSGIPLSSNHVANAFLGPEAPSSLDFSHLNLSEIPDDAVDQLVQRRASDDGQSDGSIHRIALSNNHLRTLPRSFHLLRRLRYLNLRSNALTHFPDVLSDMPSLEILDLSRNKIKSFPVSPGTLINIRVLHLGRNCLDMLPTYFPNLRELSLLKIEHNPITWPPPHVLNATANGSDLQVASKWVLAIQSWIRDDLARYGPTTDSARWEYPRNDAEPTRSPAHDRTPSNESNGSHVSSFSQSSAPDSPREFRAINRLLQAETADGYSSSSVDGHHGILTPHSKNASLTLGRKQFPNGLPLNPKKSLPELRSIHLRGADRKPKGRPPLPETFPIQHHQSSYSKGSASDTGHTVRPSPRNNLRDEEETENKQLPPMDGESSSYFRRMSTLPASTISKAVPKCLLVTVDAARGILFALSQIYSALRHYTVFAINDRLAGVLNKVLDPASQYLSRLITALDRFDALCRSGTPRPAACRGVLESCRDNITVFSKVVGVLQIQLKVFAGSDDLRYTRTLIMMLYGSMGELSNSWNAIVPHIEEVQNLVRDTPESTTISTFANAQRAAQVIPEYIDSSSSEMRSNLALGRPRRPPLSEQRRREGGSFSINDVKIGKELPIFQPNSVQPLNIKPQSAASKNLRSHLRQPPSASSPRSNQGHGYSMHSPSPSASSHGHGSNHAYSNGHGDSPVNGMLSSDKDTLVDASMLSSMEESTDLALRVWKQIEDLFEVADEGNPVNRDYLMRTRELTMSLRSNIRALLDGGDGEMYGASLLKKAMAFSLDVANILKYVKEVRLERRIPLDPSLREDIQKLSHTTQEFMSFLKVSSFATGKPPASPAPSALMSPTPYDDRSPTPYSAGGHGTSLETTPTSSNPLWRSRSANVIGSPPPSFSGPTLSRGAGTVGGNGVYQHSIESVVRESPQWSGPAHPSLSKFRTPPSPIPGSRRQNGGVVGYKDSD